MKRLESVVCALAVLVPIPGWALPSHTRVEVVSVADDGSGSNGASARGAVSADGGRVAFISAADNLVPGDTNGVPDVFVRDRLAGTTTRVSVSSSAAQANGGSHDSVAISGNGRFVAFASEATNLVPNDTNGVHDVFVHDLVTGRTVRASVADDGGQALDPGGIGSLEPSLSYDGTRVAFTSFSANLAASDHNGAPDVFVRDLAAGWTRRVSVSSSGQEGDDESTDPSISGDGTRVGFTSLAGNLTAGDEEGFLDVFVHDLPAGRTSRLTAGANQASGYASLNHDGRVIAFQSAASNLVAGDTNGRADIFVADERAGTVEIVSAGGHGPANGHSYTTTIDGPGRRVAFWSEATNLDGHPLGDALHVYVRDRERGRTCIVRAETSAPPLRGTFEPALAARAPILIFTSASPDADFGNTNVFGDVYATPARC